MLNISTPKQPDFDLYEKRIGCKGNFVYIDFEKYRNALREYISLLASAEDELMDLVSVYSVGKFKEISRSIIQDILINYCGLNSDAFKLNHGRNRTGNLSMSKEVLNPIYKSLKTDLNIRYGYLCAFKLLTSYFEYDELKGLVQGMQAKVKKFEMTDAIGYNGWKLPCVPFIYTRQSTGRYYTRNNSLQNWNLKFVNTFVAPKDYFLVWCDFEQVDLRVAYNLILQKPGSQMNEIFSKYEDKYEGFVRAMSAQMGIPFDYDTFKRNRPGYKQGILAKMYGAGDYTISKYFADPSLVKTLGEYFDSNEGYQRYVESLRKVLKLRDYLPVKDYFGVERNIEINMPPYFNNKIIEETLDKGLNTPVQSTTNSIVVEWVNATLDTMRAHGYDKDKIRVYLLRHDEAVMLVHKDVMKDMWILGNNLNVAIDNWDLLKLEVDFGYHYKEHSDELQAQFDEVMKANADKITKRTVTEPRKVKFEPVCRVIHALAYSTLSAVAFAQRHKLVSNECKSEEEALNAIKGNQEGEKFENLDCRRYIAYYDKVILENPYNNTYMVTKNLGRCISLAHKLNSKFVKLWNSTSTGFTVIQDVHLFITSNIDAADKLKYMLEKTEKEDTWYPNTFVYWEDLT